MIISKIKDRKSRKQMVVITLLAGILLLTALSLWHFFHIDKQQNKTYSGAKFVFHSIYHS